MFKTNILTTKMLTILRMLSALVLISPMGVTAKNFQQAVKASRETAGFLAVSTLLTVPTVWYLTKSTTTNIRIKHILIISGVSFVIPYLGCFLYYKLGS